MSIKCPKCQSEQITSHKNGFGISKAILGALTFGGIGIAAGAIGKNKVYNHCINCGNKWKPMIKHNISDIGIKKEEPLNKIKNPDNVIKPYSKEDYNIEFFKRTGMSASDPKFTKLGKSKKRRKI